MDIPLYFRNRCTSVEVLDDNTLRSSCRLQDTLTDAYVEITAKLPEMEITDVSGHLTRTYQEECHGFQSDDLKKVIGVRIGPGMLKIIKGLLGEATECKQLSFMVEECCHGVILSLNKDMLMPLAKSGVEPTKELFAAMVKENIRLYNRCAAFAPGSPIVEGIEPP
jgi:hypothetical protein